MSKEQKQQEQIIRRVPTNDEQRRINNDNGNGNGAYRQDEGRDPRPAEAPMDSESPPSDD